MDALSKKSLAEPTSPKFLCYLILAPLIAHLPLGARANELLIIAHRGASGYLPEHTLVGATAAHIMNADYVEPDVVLTQDNVPIVLHDVILDTVTDVARRYPSKKREDGHFYAIDFSLAEIKTLRVNERVTATGGESVFPRRFPQGLSSLQIPSLEELYELIYGLNQSRNRRVGIYPEIKAPSFHKRHGKDSTAIIYHQLMQLQRRMPNLPVIIQCFEAQSLKRLRNEFKATVPLNQLFPVADPMTLGTSKTLAQQLTASAKYANIAGLPYRAVLNAKGKSTGIVALAHQAGLQVHVYTLRVEQLPPYVNSLPKLAARLRNEGVEGIFTDFSDIRAGL